MTDSQTADRHDDPVLVLLRTLIELQATNNAAVARVTRRIDTMICVLEHISERACASLNEAHAQTGLHAAMVESAATLVALARASHPAAALQEAQDSQLRQELLRCCPPPEPVSYCTYEPCAVDEDGSGSNESTPGSAEPNRVFGAPFPPAEFSDDENDEPNEDRGPDVPRGPFRGFITPNEPRVLRDLHSGGGDDPDPVVFQTYTPYGATATPLSAVAADISGAEAGTVVLATGNWYAVYSTDSGATFTSVNPTAVFPNTADGGFCCDQIIQYVPSIDRFIWLMQFNPGKDGRNRLRIAAASPQDVVTSKCTAWTYWDLTSAQFGFSNDMDYPDMAVGDNFLYLSVDQRGAGLLVVRVPLSEIQAATTINFRYTTPYDSASAYGSHLSQNTGDEVYWAGCGSPKDNATMQVFSWQESSTSYFWRDVGLSNWPNNTLTSSAPDGNDWLAKLNNFPRFGVTGATRRDNEVWFAWNASDGDGGHGGFKFPHAHVQIAKVDPKNGYKLLEQTQIWNNDVAFAYPCLATNDRNEVGVTLGWGGGNTFYANSAVGILGDFVVWYPELSDIATTRWGDFVTARRASPEPGLFAGFGYAVLKNTTPTGYRFDPFYILFGRKSLINPGPVIG